MAVVSTRCKIAGVKLGKITIDATAFDIKGIRGSVAIDPLVINEQNPGDATILSIHTKFSGAKVTITQALLDIKLYGALIGNVITEVVGPPATALLKVKDNINFPYFKFEIDGDFIESDGVGTNPVSVHATVYKMKLTESPKIDLDEKTYVVVSFSGTAIADDTHQIFDILETSAI